MELLRKNIWNGTLIDCFLLFLTAFFIYNINLRPIATGDSVSTALVPVTLLTKGSIVMDDFERYYEDYYQKHSVELPAKPYFFTSTRFGYLPSYPIATSLLLTPFYSLPVYLFDLHKPSTSEWVFFGIVAEKIFASFVTACSVSLFYLLCIYLDSPRLLSLLLSLAYAFASQAWSTSSQALWQHGPSVFFLLFVCLTALRHNHKPKHKTALLLSVLCGIAVAVRPTNLLFVLPLYLWMIFKSPSYFISLSIPALFIALLLSGYNYLVFGNIEGFYSQMPFSTAFSEGFSGLLFSPGRGLLIYFPLAILGLIGYYYSLNKKSAHLWLYSIMMVFIFLQILVMSKWYSWWGGHSYGPRLLAETQPMLLLLSVTFFRFLKLTNLKLFLISILFIWSFLVQGIGAFLYPIGHWNGIPSNVDFTPKRLWDWMDNPMSRDVKAFIHYINKNGITLEAFNIRLERER